MRTEVRYTRGEEDARPASGTGQASARSAWFTLLLSFLVAIVEGVHVVSFGIAAPDLHARLAIEPSRIGLLASLLFVGLILGSFLGGRLADRFGKKWLLVSAVLGSAVFALGSAFSQSFFSLSVARFLLGACLGVIMPNIIALAAEAGEPAGQVGRVGFVTSGMPGGGVMIGIAAATLLAQGWQTVFLFAASASALLLPFLIYLLPGERFALERLERFEREPPSNYRAILFGKRRWRTVAIWVSGFSNQLLIFLLISWLPTLMRAAGASHKGGAAAIALFNIGGLLAGLFVARFARGNKRWSVPLICYSGVILGLLVLLVQGVNLNARFGAVLVLGVCAVGGQLLVFGLSAETYEQPERGTGVGVATAVARVGATVGPAFAGAVWGSAASTAALLSALLPLSIVAGAACFWLAKRVPRIT
jgi:AAHS family 3-hydroxyphenylpropionic acid transporter